MTTSPHESLSEQPMREDEIRQFECNGSIVILAKGPTHSSIEIVGQEYPQGVEDAFYKYNMGGVSAKMSKPDKAVDPDREYITAPGKIVRITANWLKPEEFKKDVLEPLKKENLIDDTIYDSF